MAYIPGNIVTHKGRCAVVADVKPPAVLVLHFMDENGETLMRPAEGAEAICPQTGNPRPYVTYEEYVPDSEVQPAQLHEIPQARWPVAEPPVPPQAPTKR